MVYLKIHHQIRKFLYNHRYKGLDLSASDRVICGMCHAVPCHGMARHVPCQQMFCRNDMVEVPVLCTLLNMGSPKHGDVMLFDFIPVLFILGVFMRNCNLSMQGFAPTLGGTIVQYALHMRVKSLFGEEHHNEYVKTLVVALATWSKWHEQLPPRCLSKEPCEALLSCVVMMLRKHPITYPPPPCPRTTLRKNQPLVPRSNSRITFFTGVVGFSCFWWM